MPNWSLTKEIIHLPLPISLLHQHRQTVHPRKGSCFFDIIGGENEPELAAESEESLFNSFVNTDPRPWPANDDWEPFLPHMYRKYVASKSGLESTNYSLDQLFHTFIVPHSLMDDLLLRILLTQDPLFQLVQSTPPPPVKKATFLQATAIQFKPFTSFHPNRENQSLHLQFLCQMTRKSIESTRK